MTGSVCLGLDMDIKPLTVSAAAAELLPWPVGPHVTGWRVRVTRMLVVWSQRAAAPVPPLLPVPSLSHSEQRGVGSPAGGSTQGPHPSGGREGNPGGPGLSAEHEGRKGGISGTPGEGGELEEIELSPLGRSG